MLDVSRHRYPNCDGISYANRGSIVVSPQMFNFKFMAPPTTYPRPAPSLMRQS
jgi:hypothetical protein